MSWSCDAAGADAVGAGAGVSAGDGVEGWLVDSAVGGAVDSLVSDVDGIADGEALWDELLLLDDGEDGSLDALSD